MGCFFDLGCFSVVVCVWEEGLFHTLFMDAMLKCVGVSVEVCWPVHFCVTFRCSWEEHGSLQANFLGPEWCWGRDWNSQQVVVITKHIWGNFF